MIRLSKLTDYAFVALTHIVSNDPQRVHAAKDVAEQVGLPVPTVSKILKSLARNGFLVAHRGMKGGYSLARPADRISVAEVVTALDGPIALTDCLTGRPVDCMVENCCCTRGKWGKVNSVIQRALQSVTLADMGTPEVSALPAALQPDGIATGRGGVPNAVPAAAARK